MGKEEEKDEEEEEEESGAFNLRFLTHGRGARRTFVGTTSATHRGELGGVSRPRESQTRFRFPTSLSLSRCSRLIQFLPPFSFSLSLSASISISLALLLLSFALFDVL